jgi:hypothetical protein
MDLTDTEEKALVGILYNHVSFGTTLQVFGEAGEDNARINTLRTAFEKLLTKYGLLNTLSPENLVMVGIIKTVPKDTLAQFAADENNKHLQLRARYFLKETN